LDILFNFGYNTLPGELFFDENNVGFSHLKCNIGAARKPSKKYFTEEEKIEARRKWDREKKRRIYTPERRRKKWLETGH